MSIEHILAYNILRIRKGKGWSQKDLCEKTGLTQGQLSAFENGRIPPNIKTIERIALALDVPVYELFRNPDGKNQSLQEKMDAILQLPPEKRAALLEVIDSVIRENEGRKAE